MEIGRFDLFGTLLYHSTAANSWGQSYYCPFLSWYSSMSVSLGGRLAADGLDASNRTAVRPWPCLSYRVVPLLID